MGTNESTDDMGSRLRGEAPIDESEVFHILGNDRRREIIASVTDHSDGVEVADLASEIARQEQGEAEPAKDIYKSVYVSLQQTHLPKLAEEGVIRHDPETNVVEPGPQLDEVTVYVTDEAARRRQLWPLVVSLVGVLVVLAAVNGAPVVGAVSAPVWAVVFLLVTAAVGVYVGRR